MTTRNPGPFCSAETPTMYRPLRLCLTLLACAAGWLAFAQPGPAYQPPQPPPPAAPAPWSLYNPASPVVTPPPATMQGTTRPSAASLSSNVPIFNPAYPNAPGGGYGWGPGGYGMGRYGGYLQGAANVTVANAQYQLTTQQARIVRAQANREALKTRQAYRDQQDYERADWLQKHDPQKAREQEIAWNLRRSLNDPPAVEIWSGQVLNSLFMDLQKAEAAGVRGPPVFLSPGILDHINLTTGTTTASGQGVLKNLTNFQWPLVLRKAIYRDLRVKIEEMTQKAVAQVGKPGGIDADLLDGIDETVQALMNTVDANATEATMTPTQYVQASRFVKELKGSLKVLQDPNVAMYFNGSYKARGQTVADLVANMSSQGLKFAPAAPGDEPSYTSLHQSMVTYNTRLREMSSLSARPGP